MRARRALLESIEPVWYGNKVWFIFAGGAVFAGLATAVRSLALGPVPGDVRALFALILRPVGFMFRNKIAVRA